MLEHSDRTSLYDMVVSCAVRLSEIIVIVLLVWNKVGPKHFANLRQWSGGGGGGGWLEGREMCACCVGGEETHSLGVINEEEQGFLSLSFANCFYMISLHPGRTKGQNMEGIYVKLSTQ